MAVDASKPPLYSVVAFSHSSVDDFRNPYLQTFHSMGVSKTRLSKPHPRQSSHPQQRSHTESVVLEPSTIVSEALTQVPLSGSSSPPPSRTQPASGNLDGWDTTSSQHPTHALTRHKYGSLRATAVPEPDIPPKSRSHHASLARAQSTSGSGSDVASSPRSRSSFWLTYPYQGSSMNPRSPSMCQRTSSTPHIRSGSISDGSIAIPVDMKRLLSKPALPTSSPVSLPTDSDSQHSAGRRQRSARSTSRTRLRPKLHREPSVGPSAGKPDDPREKEERLFTESPTDMVAPPVPPQPAPASPASTAKDQKPPKPRYLVKRRPSLIKAPPPGSISPVPPVPLIDETKKRHSPTTNSGVRTASRSPRPPDSSKLSGSRQNSGSLVVPRVSPSSLTPAGAVAAAYMEQEARREDLALASQTGDVSHRGRTPTVKAKHDEVTPYYTVLGTSAGRVVAVDDDEWELKLEPVRSTEERLRLASSSTPRNLTKKLSGKWKKAVWSPCDVSRRDSSPSVGTPGTQPDPRPSPHDRQNPAKVHDDIDPFRLSLEKFAEDSLTKFAIHNDRSRTWSESPQDQQKPAPRRVHSEMLSGNKMWRLMKRISGGAMREKYVQQDSPPPVPELPKHPFYLNGTGSQDGHDGSYSLGILNRFMQSRTSMSGAHPLSRNPSPGLEPATPPTAPGHGASATTRSSSPNSSEIMFARSRRSSLHSDPGDLTTSPKRFIAKHIISPSELYLLDPDNDPPPLKASPPATRNLSRRTDDWVSRSPEIELASLPLPPMRHAMNKQEVVVVPSRDPSPMIPSFSNSDAINTFGSRGGSPASTENAGRRSRPPLTLFTSQTSSPSSTPPPRPPRNPKRAASTSRSATAAGGGDPSSHAASSRIQFPSSEMHDDDGGGAINSHRRKVSSDGFDRSTGAVVGMRARRRSNSLEGLSRPRRERKMTLTFRELGDTPTAPTLTEQEKADRWDDLLLRSARAGGTLHIGGEELVSDELHFSDVSEATFGRDGYTSQL